MVVNDSAFSMPNFHCGRCSRSATSVETKDAAVGGINRGFKRDRRAACVGLRSAKIARSRDKKAKKPMHQTPRLCLLLACLFFFSSHSSPSLLILQREDRNEIQQSFNLAGKIPQRTAADK